MMEKNCVDCGILIFVVSTEIRCRPCQKKRVKERAIEKKNIRKQKRDKKKCLDCNASLRDFRMNKLRCVSCQKKRKKMLQDKIDIAHRERRKERVKKYYKKAQDLVEKYFHSDEEVNL